ncbi:MAG TPA: hypothetical protein VM143_04205 [Acidimicrobiales bacterium]|nr:hypothetical protein [Acidimicrobiales bacterium]
MLRVFGFERIGVVVSDLYFVDPRPSPGEEGPEHGVRLEVRFLEQGELKGSIYSARPIAVDRPIWRADLLESYGSNGTYDRTHHHPRFHGWNPTRRHFVEELSSDPLGWLQAKLEDLAGLLEHAQVPIDDVTPADLEGLRAAAPEIVDVVRRTLDEVRAGRLGQPPVADGELTSARASWL